MKAVLLSAVLVANVGSSASAQICPAGDTIAAITAFASVSGYEQNGTEPIAEAVQSILSTEGLEDYVSVLCAFEAVESERHRNHAIRAVLNLVASPEVDDIDEWQNRLAARLGVELPEDGLTLLRAEIGVVEARIAARNAAIMADLAERQAAIEAQRERIRELDAEIARLQERLEAIRAGTDEEIRRIRADTARLRALRGSLEGIIDVIEGRAPVSALD